MTDGSPLPVMVVWCVVVRGTLVYEKSLSIYGQAFI